MSSKPVYLSLLLLFALILMATRCGADQSPAPVPEKQAVSEKRRTGKPATEEPAGREKPFAGTELVLASINDPFVAAFRDLLPEFEEETGIKVILNAFSYGDLYQKITADFKEETATYDLMTVDIVWSGEYGTNQYTLPVDNFMDRDKEELQLDDILPVAWRLGEWEDRHWAYPLAGYANLLYYRQDVLDKAGFEPPETQQELKYIAAELTEPEEAFYGIAPLGAGGPAVAQGYMARLQQHGGSILDRNGNPALNTAKNVDILNFYGSLLEYAPPGAAGYGGHQQETAFCSGKVALMEGWSANRARYEDPDISSIVGKTAVTVAPVAEGMEPTYGFSGWGIGINADSSPEKQEAAWEFIKWITSPDVQKEWIRNNGAPIRRSTLEDPKLVAEYPWFPIILEAFEKGDGDYRPRIPEYSLIEKALGTAVNSYLIGELSAQEALDQAQAQVETAME